MIRLVAVVTFCMAAASASTANTPVCRAISAKLRAELSGASDRSPDSIWAGKLHELSQDPLPCVRDGIKRELGRSSSERLTRQRKLVSSISGLSPSEFTNSAAFAAIVNAGKVDDTFFPSTPDAYSQLTWSESCDDSHGGGDTKSVRPGVPKRCEHPKVPGSEHELVPTSEPSSLSLLVIGLTALLLKKL